MSLYRKIIGSYLVSSALLTAKHFTPTILSESKSSTMTSTEFSIAYVTAPDINVAKTIAEKLVESGLAACVNIVPGVTSVYKWKEKIESDSEVLMMIKTRTERVEQLTSLVKDNHPYEVCEVITVAIQYGNKQYMDWLSETIPKP